MWAFVGHLTQNQYEYTNTIVQKSVRTCGRVSDRAINNKVTGDSWKLKFIRKPRCKGKTIRTPKMSSKKKKITVIIH